MEAPLDEIEEALEYIDAESVEKIDMDSLEYIEEALDWVSWTVMCSKALRLSSQVFSSLIVGVDRLPQDVGREAASGSSRNGGG